MSLSRTVKSLMLVFAILLSSNLGHAQGLEHGNLIGVHVVKVDLKPGATMDEFTTFYVQKVIPEYEKNWPGLKGYLLKSFFDDSRNKIAIIWLFKTVQDRNRNFNADGSANELERAGWAKVRPVEDKLKDLYGNYTVTYTHEDDWVVQ
jgi:hypothetical protein